MLNYQPFLVVFLYIANALKQNVRIGETQVTEDYGCLPKAAY